MTAITAWLDELRATVPGAEDDYLTQQLKAAVRVFAKDSGAFIVEQQNIAVTSGVSAYNIGSLVSSGTVQLILAGYWGRVPMKILTEPPRGADTTATGTPYAFYPTSIGNIRLFPIPIVTESDKFDMTVSITPTNPATVPDEFFSMWFDEILHGAAMRLFLAVNKPWENEKLAKYHGSKFRSGISQARNTVRSRYSTATQPWRFPPWAK